MKTCAFSFPYTQISLTIRLFLHRRERRQLGEHGAADPVAGGLPHGAGHHRDLGAPDDVSPPRYYLARPHRAVHEAADNHAARLAQQFDARRCPRRSHVLRRVHLEAGQRLRQQPAGHHTVAPRYAHTRYI